MASLVSLTLAGSVIDGFLVGEEIGRGAQNIVYGVSRDGEEYALKLQRQMVAGSDVARAFRREAAMLSTLHHPGLVRIHAVGEIGGRPYLLMERLLGETLRAALDGHPEPWPESRVVTLAQAVAGALAAAHRSGLVHRDVKPENVFVTVAGEIKVIDFGLAAQSGVQQDRDVAVGTAQYSPPEQTGMLSRPVDGRSDLYSLGVVLYESVAGRRPFESNDVGELIRQHAVQAPPPLRERRPGLSAAFVAVVERMLAKDPDDRYQTGEGLLADLDRIIAFEPEGGADFVAGLSDDPAAVVYDLALVGRQAELDRLTGAWRQTLRGNGGVVVVEGSSGEGKSRLARELVRLTRSDGALVLTAKVVDGSPVPLAGLRDAIDRHLRTLGQLPSDLRTVGEDHLVRAAEGSGGMLATFSPTLGAMLGQRPNTTDTDDRQEQYLAAIGQFLLNLATAHGSAVLGIDDVQWLDDTSRSVLRGIAATLQHAPLLIIGTGRNDTGSRSGTERFCVDVDEGLRDRIVLGPLDEAGVTALVHELLGGPVTDRGFIGQLHIRGNGNPFATVEYLHAVLDAGLLRPSWGAFVVDSAGLDHLNLPADVIELVLRRADDLGADARALLAAGAAVGPQFTPSMLGEVIDADERRLAAAVADALRARLIERVEGESYGFVHDRIREAMLDHLEPGELRNLHQRLAELFEAIAITGPDVAFTLARHYTLGESTPAKVFQWNEAAGRAAMTSYATTEANELFTRAATAAEQAGIEVDAGFEETFGIITLRAGVARDALAHLLYALELTTEPTDRARIYASVARAEFGNWQVEACWTSVCKGLEAIGWRFPDNAVRLWLGTLWNAGGGLLSTLTHRGFGEAQGGERTELETVVALYEMGIVASLVSERSDRMLAIMLRSVPITHRLGESGELVRSYGQLAMGAGMLRQFGLVERLVARALAVAETLGDPHLVAGAHACHAYAYEFGGDTVRAAEIADIFLAEHSRWLDLGNMLPAATAHLLIRHLRGLTREAHHFWMTGHERAQRSNHPGASTNRGQESDELGDEPDHEQTVMAGAITHAAAGRFAEAAKLLHLAEKVIANDDAGHFRKVEACIVKILHMVEVDELEDYDRLTDEIDQLEINPLTCGFYLKIGFGLTTHAAIERVRRASAEQRPARLTEARKRLRKERLAAVEPIYRAYFAVNRAAMAQMENNHRKAMRLAAKAEKLAIRTEAPAIHFEVACVRARVAIDQGRRGEACRQARHALHLATTYEWITRIRLVKSEFGELAEPITGSPTASAASSQGGRSVTGLEANQGAQSRRDRSLDALLALSVAASQVHDPDELAWVALDQLVAQLGAERAFLFLTDDDGMLGQPTAARDADGQNLVDVSDYASTVVERVRVERTALVVTGTEEGAAIGSESTVQHGLRSILAAPLMLEGRLLGVVYLDSRLAKGVFTSEDVEILAAISNHIAISIETARASRLEQAVTTERQQRDLAETLRDSMTIVSATLHPLQVLERTLETAAGAITYDRAAILLNHNDHWTVAAVAGDLNTDDLLYLDPFLDQDPHLATLTTHSLGTFGTAGGAPLPDLIGDASSWLSVPLVARRELIGVLLVAADDPAALGPAQLGLAATFAAQGIVAYENATLFEAVEQLATTDELTKLNNRRNLFKLGDTAFGVARRHQRPLAAIMIDIDHFKRVNDTHGHAAGDDVIQHVATRLQTTIRDIDIIGRYGGEEFALVLPETDEDVMIVADRLRHAIADQPITTTDAGALTVHISIGVAIMTDTDTDLADTLNRADTALYTAKTQGRNQAILAN